MESDFAQLYAWLGLRPDCTLDEFKRAYRRRVAELHPDRHPGPGSDAHASRQLSELTSLYGTATRFHRRHGRLPGAEPRGRQLTAQVVASASASASAVLAGSQLATIRSPNPAPGDSTAHRRTLFAALVVMLILVLMVVLESSLPSPGDRHETPHKPPPGSPAEQSRPGS